MLCACVCAVLGCSYLRTHLELRAEGPQHLHNHRDRGEAPQREQNHRTGRVDCGWVGEPLEPVEDVAEVRVEVPADWALVGELDAAADDLR